VVSGEAEFDAADWPLLAFAVRRLRRDRELMLPRGVRDRLAGLDERLVRAAVAAQVGTVGAPPAAIARAGPPGSLTVAEKAAAMGCSTSYVRRLIRDKRLPARWTAAGWLIAVPDAEPDSAAS
jgi:excisionase family DNA binding protein